MKTVNSIIYYFYNNLAFGLIIIFLCIAFYLLVKLAKGYCDKLDKCQKEKDILK